MTLELARASTQTGREPDLIVPTSDAEALYILLAKAARAGLPAPALRELCTSLRRREHGVRAALAQLVADGLVEAAGTKERRRWRLPALGLITADRPPPSAFFREGSRKRKGRAPHHGATPAPSVEVREDGVRVTRCPTLWAEGSLHFRPWGAL